MTAAFSEPAAGIDGDGWLDGALRVASPNCDARPDGAVVSLIVWFITALGGWAVLAWWTKQRAKAAAQKRAD